MIRELLVQLPEALLRCPPGTAALCACGGVVLWVVGARFSRSILALVAVTAGAIVGMHLPAWRGWQVDGMGLAVGAAIALGTAAFLFHRACIGLLLGAALMLWAGFGTWAALAGDRVWNWHPIEWKGDLVQLLRDTWATLPPDLARVVPLACLAGLSGGVMLAILLPKFSKVLAHSLIGITLITVMGIVALSATHPDWLVHLAGPGLVQGGVLGGLVAAGAAWQWQITPPRASARNRAAAPDSGSRKS